MKTKVWFALVAALLCLQLPARGADVVVSAAASLKDVLEELEPLCQKQTGVSFTTNLAASGVLAQQIKSGAPADIFISADDETMDGLEKAGLLLAGSRARLLDNSLVIVVPVADTTKYTSPDFIAGAGIKHLAIGDPKTVPAGRYAMAYLDKLKLTDAVKDKLVPLENVRTVLAAVAAGNADAGLVYRTDALTEKKVRAAWTAPASDGPAVHYPIAILKASATLELDAKVRAFFFSDAARAVFTRYGFTVPDKSAAPKPAAPPAPKPASAASTATTP